MSVGVSQGFSAAMLPAWAYQCVPSCHPQHPLSAYKTAPLWLKHAAQHCVKAGALLQACTPSMAPTQKEEGWRRQTVCLYAAIR